MKGFLDRTEIDIKRSKMNTKKISGCQSCGVYNQCENGKMSYTGNGDKKILIIDGSVTKREETTGEILQSINGKYLRSALQSIGIDLERDCWYVHSIQCYSKEVSNIMMNSCKTRLKNIVSELKPEKIITLGAVPLELLIGDRFTGRLSVKPTNKFYGYSIPDQELGCWLFPNYDVNFLLDTLKIRKNKLKGWGKWNSSYNKMPLWEVPTLKNHDDFVIREKFFMKYLKNVTINKKFRIHNYDKEACSVLKVEDAIHILKQMQKESIVSFDYETTGIKPHRKGHEILTVSFSNGIVSYGFPIFKDNPVFMKELRRVLQSKHVGKISHNMAFEYSWTSVILGYKVRNFKFDTMLSSHILDNRSGITGLKFQTYVNLGVIGYDTEADKYIGASNKEKEMYGTNGFNKLKLLDAKKTCQYCAEDSHYTYKIYEKHKAMLDDNMHLTKGYKLFHNGLLSFSKMMENGFIVNTDQVLKNVELIKKRMGELQYKISVCDEMEKWKEQRDIELNYHSSKQLSDFLFNVLQLPKTKYTAKNQLSTEAKELEDLITRSDFVKYYLELAKLNKILNTDLNGIKKEMVNDRIYPMFSLNIPQSYRGSSQNPNFQNHSKHDHFASEMVRGVLNVAKGRRIIGADASSLEVGTGVSIHRDPTMLKQYEEGLDMHLGLAEKLFLGELNEVSDKMIEIKKRKGTYEEKYDTKDLMFQSLRYIGKNGMSFSLQFGDIYLSIGPTVWGKHLEDYHKEYFKTKGINNEKEFVEHIKTVCDWYWEENYGEFGKWRKSNWNSYVKSMKTTLKTGFYSTTLMSRNQANNYVIQGPAFHLILDAQVQIQKYIDDHNLSTKIIAQIHDAIYFDTPEDLSEWIDEGLGDVVVYYMTGYLMNKHRWVIHTMKADVEYYDNNNWSDHIKEEELLEKYGYSEKDKMKRVIKEIT